MPPFKVSIGEFAAFLAITNNIHKDFEVPEGKNKDMP
jgi:hypothetical protein